MQTRFETDILAVLPQLRRQAMAMTRNRADAEDLVQDAVTSALASAGSFVPGTHFGAWMHRIVRNRFISVLRRRRPTTHLDDASEAALSVRGNQEARLLLKEVAIGVAMLPRDGRKALEMVALHGMSYGDISDATGYAIGTGKSRVFRARRQLETWMETGLMAGEAAIDEALPMMTTASMPAFPAPHASRAA